MLRPALNTLLGDDVAAVGAPPDAANMGALARRAPARSPGLAAAMRDVVKLEGALRQARGEIRSASHIRTTRIGSSDRSRSVRRTLAEPSPRPQHVLSESGCAPQGIEKRHLFSDRREPRFGREHARIAMSSILLNAPFLVQYFAVRSSRSVTMSSRRGTSTLDQVCERVLGPQLACLGTALITDS